jgi:hypothetical protein
MLEQELVNNLFERDVISMKYKVRLLTLRKNRRREDAVLEGTLSDILGQLSSLIESNAQERMMVTFEPATSDADSVSDSEEVALNTATA